MKLSSIYNWVNIQDGMGFQFTQVDYHHLISMQLKGKKMGYFPVQTYGNMALR